MLRIKLLSGRFSSGPTTKNLTAEFNDFNQIHRIPWEEQPEAVSGVVFQYNTIHDWTNPYFGSFGVSFACCANPASTSPVYKCLKQRDNTKFDPCW